MVREISGIQQRPGQQGDSQTPHHLHLERAERAAIIVTTNLPFSEWTTVFPNPRLCKALLDRITDRDPHHRNRNRVLSLPAHVGKEQKNVEQAGRGEPFDGPGVRSASVNWPCIAAAILIGGGISKGICTDWNV
jgi:hypothetical protein